MLLYFTLINISLTFVKPFPVDNQHRFDSGAPTPVFFSPDINILPTNPIVAVYYPDWTAAQLPPESVNFDKIDWVDFAFAVPHSSTLIPTFSDPNSEILLQRLVAAAHLKKKHVKLSIGGWTGSAHFSDAVNPQNRLSFAHHIVDIYKKFDLDGIDIDWEYPGESGAPGNTHTPADTLNFLEFLRILRSFLPPHARITAATQVWPFVDATAQHMQDVSAFAHVLDWILIMNYDVWGSSSTPGPNAPLSDACHNSSQSDANAHASIAHWHAAGFPLNQIMLGLPAYGYVSRSTAARLRTRRRDLPTYDRTPVAEEDVLAVASEEGSTDTGQVQFRALVTQGALARGPTGAFLGAGGFERHWDACSSTPFLRSELAGQVITYDDPESLALKAAYARQAGILGVNMWDAHGDTAAGDLVAGIRRGLGLE